MATWNILSVKGKFDTNPLAVFSNEQLTLTWDGPGPIPVTFKESAPPSGSVGEFFEVIIDGGSTTVDLEEIKSTTYDVTAHDDSALNPSGRKITARLTVQKVSGVRRERAR